MEGLECINRFLKSGGWFVSVRRKLGPCLLSISLKVISRYGTETSIAGTLLHYPCHVQISCFGHLNEEQQTSTTTAPVDVENWNAQSIDLGANTASTSSEHDSTGLSSEDDSTGLPLACGRAGGFSRKSSCTFWTKTGHVQMKRAMVCVVYRVLSLHNLRTYRDIPVVDLMKLS